MTDRPANPPAQVFLVLFPGAVGCLLGSLVADPGFKAGFFAFCGLTVAVVLAVAGIAASLLSLKKPLRSYRFIRGVGRSPLSRQAFVVGLFTAILVVHWALALAGRGVLGLGIVAVVVGAGAVLATGVTYRLDSQPGWRHWSTLAFLFGGLLAVGGALALAVALAWPDSLRAGSAGIQAVRGLVIAGGGVLLVATTGRSSYLSRGGRRTADNWTLLRKCHRLAHLSGAVLVVVDTAAAVVALTWAWAVIVALATATAAQWVHWRLFFVTGIPLNWRSEVRWSRAPLPIAKER